MNESKSGNKYHKWPSRENFLAIKIAIYIWNSRSKSTKKNYFEKAIKKGLGNNKAFSNAIKPFLTNKGFNVNENITIRNKDKILKIVRDKTKLLELFNSHYINRIEKTSAMWPEIEGNPKLKNNDQSNIKSIYSIILALSISKIAILIKNTLISQQSDWCN